MRTSRADFEARCARISTSGLAGLLAVVAFTGCGTEHAVDPASLVNPTAVATTSALPSPFASASPSGSVEPTSLAQSSVPNDTPGGWYHDDFAHRDDVSDGVWVAAWFAPADAFPDSVVRWWRVVELGAEPTPSSLLAGSVGLLDDSPPDGMSSAFGRGLDVIGVTIDGRQVVLDIAADSPGLHGHASIGAILGESQLVAAAAHYFPDADTLCVTYDGAPTDVDAGGPIFLHDASGCPLALP